MTNLTKRTRTLLLMLALAALAGGRSVVADDGRDHDVDPLVGVWESVAPNVVDCQTGEVPPDTPTIRAVYTFHHGGTLSEQNTDPIEGPYRSSGAGIWKRTSGRNYVAVYGHYGFVDENLMPIKELGAVIKIRTAIRLARDAKSLSERGRFDVFFPDPETNELGEAFLSGCFAATSHRLTFQ